MGKASLHKKAFLKAHPLCCFCGGQALATTIDHQPARALFDAKNWPEDYEFPACSTCNAGARQSENVLAVLVRMAGSGRGDLRRLEMQKYLRSMRNNFPELTRPFTANEKRRALRNINQKLPEGTFLADFPIIGLEASLTESSIGHVVQKLMKAFHFLHTGRIVPSQAIIYSDWITNSYKDEVAEVEPFMSALGGRPILKRGSNGLHDQFDYIYGLDDEGRFSAFAMFFRSSFMAYGTVDFDSDANAGTVGTMKL